jgi:hypothetical protein
MGFPPHERGELGVRALQLMIFVSNEFYSSFPRVLIVDSQLRRIGESKQIPPRVVLRRDESTPSNRLHLLTTQLLQRPLISMIRDETESIRFQPTDDKGQAGRSITLEFDRVCLCFYAVVKISELCRHAP